MEPHGDPRPGSRVPDPIQGSVWEEMNMDAGDRVRWLLSLQFPYIFHDVRACPPKPGAAAAAKLEPNQWEPLQKITRDCILRKV